MSDTVKVFSKVENPFELKLPRKRGPFKFARGEHPYPTSDLEWACKQPQIKQLFTAGILKVVAAAPTRATRRSGVEG